MNNYAIRQTPSTATGGPMIRAGLLIGTLLMMPLGEEESSQPDIIAVKHPSVRREENSKTFGQYANLFTGEYEHSIFSFKETVASFYARLLARQEPLGKEFERVLHDNLWDLLVRT